jgi:hypothetical protein
MIKFKFGVESQTICSGIEALVQVEEIIKNSISHYKN